MNLHRMLLPTVIFAVSCVSAAQQPCAGFKIRSGVEVGGTGLSLDDLLAPGACPEVLAAAARIRLGNIPLPGSVRVLDGNEVRHLISDLMERLSRERLGMRPEYVQVPERVTVRRRSLRMSCAEITQVLGHALHSRLTDPEVQDSEADEQEVAGQNLDCAGSPRIPPGSPMALTKIFWDPALHNWEYTLRCIHPRDCVPFLVRARGTVARGGYAAALRITSRSMMAGPHARASLALSYSPQSQPQPQPQLQLQLQPQPRPMVRPGETVTLTWEEAGIRLVLPVVCLDRGGLGQSVRARMKSGGRVLRAEVVGEGKLRVAL